MAGINSVASDLLDEKELDLHYINKLCKEILKVSELPLITNKLEYINKIKELNYNVFDLSKKIMKPIININNLNWKIWKFNHQILSKIPIINWIIYYSSE